MNQIKYQEGYKYQLAETYEVNICIKPYELIIHDFIILESSGKLTINKGYAWDGPSGPTFDTKNFMRGSLVHDALYQLMRTGLLSEECRELADKELKRICQEDGMSSLRAWWVYKAVRDFGSSSAALAADPIITAP